VRALAEATDDPASARDVLAATTDYKGASGVITFDENGDVLKPYSIKRFIDGEAVEVAVVEP
jgi:branched-chain amino acid transport system substrate-binding protein